MINESVIPARYKAVVIRDILKHINIPSAYGVRYSVPTAWIEQWLQHLADNLDELMDGDLSPPEAIPDHRLSHQEIFFLLHGPDPVSHDRDESRSGMREGMQ